MSNSGSKSLDKVFVVGGRRGLGKAIVDEWQLKSPGESLWVSSRRAPADFICDFSEPASLDLLLTTLDELQPNRVFCVPGGGPYGSFVDKEWKDHLWALQVSLLAPARLAHHLLKQSYCQQLIFIGSQIAESVADFKAASYGSAKHGLVGLLKTLQLETTKDLRLYSPGYMATDMLPAVKREELGKPVADPRDVAVDFVKWAQTPKAAWHKTYTSAGNCD